MQPLAGPHEDRIIEHTLNELRPQIEPQRVRLAGVWSVLGCILIVLLLMICGGVLAVSWQSDRTTNLTGTVSSQSAQLGQQQSALQSYAVVAGKLANQLKQNGIQPSVTPSGMSSAVAITPAPSLTNFEIQRALQSCWMAGQCEARPTPAQLVSAFQTYCSIDGRCRGPAGHNATGVPGPSGTPGTPGDPPTTDQIKDAIAKYCSAGDICKGYPSSIVIEVPSADPANPSAVRTETCMPSSPAPSDDTEHVYTCK